MLFTENRYDRSMEQMMKGIPNFYPRGSGIVVTGNFRYTAEMCDCEYCGYYGGKKKGCLVTKCICQRNYDRNNAWNQTWRFPSQTQEIYKRKRGHPNDIYKWKTSSGFRWSTDTT